MFRVLKHGRGFLLDHIREMQFRFDRDLRCFRTDKLEFVEMFMLQFKFI